MMRISTHIGKGNNMKSFTTYDGLAGYTPDPTYEELRYAEEDQLEDMFAYALANCFA